MISKFKVTVGERVFDVLVEHGDDVVTTAAATRPAAYSAPAGSSPQGSEMQSAPVVPDAALSGAADHQIRSPLSGKVVSIETAVGKYVEAGEHVITVEAMKMNTYLHATHAGRVVAVLVRTGEGIDEGQVLIQLGA